ncbi:MAG TPA: YbhB/YbcL family Raf kinase inhibitor-like protein [Azonexus sp.]|nr:YbhB/YbcL family Raf kinase inhibitor-like protein [Azonexus sp.]
MSLTISSPSFPNNGMVPLRHTCDGLDISPALFWTGVPAHTQSLALIVDDPDAPDPVAPKVRWVHWLLYNLPADTSGLPEGVTAKTLPPPALQGSNDWGRTGYGGPCPPIGVHRYIHQLFALDVWLPDLQHPNRAMLEKAMQGHIIERAELVGRYQRE